MNSRTLGAISVIAFLGSGISFADEPWEKGTCRKKDMNYPVVDFHAHTFNFRHLPLRGILYGWGVPDFVAGVSADIVWGMTRQYGQSGSDAFAALRYDAADDAFTADFRTRALAAGIDYFSALEVALEIPEQERFERELNEYLVAEAEYEQSLRSSQPALAQPLPTPLNDYFRDLGTLSPGSASFDIGALAPDGHDAMVNAMAQLSLIDRIVALLVKPFDLVAGAPGAFRFFSTMIQAEDKVVGKLLAENCMTDYFVHYMMDLEPVYDSTAPVPFEAQHDLARKLRELYDSRLITFSAFVPYRYDQFELAIVKSAIGSGVLGLKFYPPSGYGAFVETIPEKPKRFRGIIYQGGARAQWEHRYSPLELSAVRQNWRVTITEPSRAREQTLEGVSARFLEFAHRERMLIFSHHTPQGFEGYKGYGETFAEPCDWLPALRREPGQRLILGHSGGDSWYGDDAAFNQSFSRQAYNLCVSYENVYCDFGYQEDVLSDAGKTALRNRLQAMHDLPRANRASELSPQSCRTEQAAMKYPIFDKIMYGSDWMMVIKEANYEKMVSAFDAVFTDELAQYKSNFFGGNAITILKKSGNARLLPEPLK